MILELLLTHTNNAFEINSYEYQEKNLVDNIPQLLNMKGDGTNVNENKKGYLNGIVNDSNDKLDANVDLADIMKNVEREITEPNVNKRAFNLQRRSKIHFNKTFMCLSWKKPLRSICYAKPGYKYYRMSLFF